MKQRHHSESWLRRFAKMILGNGPKQDQDWRCDPLAHPDLRDMTPDQLADLPIGPEPQDCGCR